MLALISIVVRDSLIRKLAFPRIIIPTSATLTAAMTLLINCTVVGVLRRLQAHHAHNSTGC